MSKLMELTIYGRAQSQLYVARFNFFNTSLSPTSNAALNLVEDFGFSSGAPTAPVANSPLAKLIALFNANTELTQIYCRDIYKVDDFHQQALSGAGWAGTRAGEQLPSFVASKIKSTRTRQDIKAGYKSIPGLLDADQTTSQSGTALTASYITLLASLCTTLGNGRSPFVGVTQAYFANTIVGRESYPTPSGKTAYRYYEDPEIQFANLAYPVTYTPVEFATSQVSRRPGKGR